MKLMYKPTKNVFEMSEKEARYHYEKDPFNYMVIDGIIELPKEEEPKTIEDFIIADEDEAPEEKPKRGKKG